MTAAGDPCPPNTIWFHGAENNYREFSNFWMVDLLWLQERSWKTTEHYFQAMKFEHSPKDFDEVANLATPVKAARAGRDPKRPKRADWQDIKDGIMFEACLAKFSQNPRLWELLDSTGDCHLVERSPNDKYWGDGGDGTGRNMMGITLMKVRQHIRAEWELEMEEQQQEQTTSQDGGEKSDDVRSPTETKQDEVESKTKDATQTGVK